MCEWDGWHRLDGNEGDLPKKDGVYLIRYSEDGENSEVEGGFSVTPKQWSRYIKEKSQWEHDFYDGWSGWAGVYAWKEIS